jgi:hypothetical protein
VIDSCREASPDGEAEGHSDHRSQSGCSPRSLVEEGRRNGIIGAPGEMGDEIDALRVDGAARADRDDDEAHIGPDVAILVAPRVSSDGKVGRHARAVSVVGCDVGCASRVQSFDVDEDKGVGPIVVVEDDVRDVRDRMILHPLVNSSLASLAAALGCDSRGTQDCIEKGDESLHSGVMASGMESHAVGAWHKVPVAWANKRVA